MLSFDKNKFTLTITVSEEQKQASLADFEKMNAKINSMFKYIENPDTPEEERRKYEPLALVFLKTISEAYNILLSMGILEEELKKYCKI